MESVPNGGAPAPVENVNTPTAPPDGAPVEAVKPADPPKPEAKSDDEPKGVAKRIKELTDARRAAEAREARLLALLEQRQAPTPTTQASEDEPVKSLKDFGYNEQQFLDYSEKRATAKAEKAAKDVAERFRREQEAIARRAKFDERVEAFAKTTEDYYEVVNDSTPVSEAMADAIMDSDEAGALMYYLGQNPDVARKLYNLTPAKAGRELARLEDRLVAERAKAAAKPVSQAPPPAPRIEAAGDSGRNPDPTSAESDALSDKEWMRLREKQLQRKR